MNLRQYLRSFSGGEIAPELFGRIDLDKYNSGLERCENFEVLPHGPVANRAGFKYVLEAKDSTRAVRLIPFSYSADQTMVLEFGHQYIRFHTNAGTLLETAKNITGITQPAGVVTSNAHGYSNGDWVYLSAIGGMTQLNGRFVVVSDAATNTFRMKDFAGNYITTGSLTAYTSGGTAKRVYTVTTDYDAADLFGIHYAQTADVLTLVHPSYRVRELQRLGATNWNFDYASFRADANSVSSGVTATNTGTGGTVYEYAPCTVTANGDETAVGDYDSCSNDLSTAGNHNTITWPAQTGADRYNVYRRVNGVWGYIGWTPNTSFVDDNIIPDLSKNPPERTEQFGTPSVYPPGSGNPSATAHYEQRRVFAATDTVPHGVWMSRIGSQAQFGNPYNPTDDGPITISINAQQQNRIRHLVVLSDLIALTASGAYRIGTGGDPLSPYTISVKPASYAGANDVQPVVTDSACLYVQAQGSKIRELSYSWEAQSYRADDVSVLAPHLVDGYTITDLAFSQAPNPMLFAVRSDGTLLALTYLPEQRVRAWHTHTTTNGTFESVCCVTENNEDVLYAVVNRTIGGRTVRYIERKASRVQTATDAFYVDSGLTYSGAASTAITGLHHLEGQTVAILADGIPQPEQTVTGGGITLDNAATEVHVGLPITATVRTLPLVLDNQPGGGVALARNVNKVNLRIEKSGGVFVGPDDDNLTELKARTTENWGQPTALKSELVDLPLFGKWGTEGQITIKQTYPLPCMIVCALLEVRVGG